MLGPLNDRVSQFLEADGRIKTIRDGRWLRTRREWVEQYVAAKTIKPSDSEVILAPRLRGKRHVNVGVKFKKGGMGHQFLQERAKRDRSR